MNHKKEKKSDMDRLHCAAWRSLNSQPGSLGVVERDLRAVFLPQELKVVAEGRVILGGARELRRGSYQDVQVLGGDDDPGGICRDLKKIINTIK